MFHLLIPSDASTTAADVWAGVVSLQGVPAVPSSASIVQVASGRQWPIGSWQRWSSPEARGGLLWQRVRLEGLTPRARYNLDLVVDDTRVAGGVVVTLPDRLPGIDETPLTVLLGSCVCSRQDKDGRVGRAFLGLPGGIRPDLKILCGDQVYLDSPWYRYLIPHGAAALGETFLKNYTETWSQTGDRQGFNHLLATGATYFCSDDHEFWNNAPYPSFAVNTWTDDGRKTWFDLACTLYRAFQTEQTVVTFSVGDLSFFVADTRINRSWDRRRFLTDQDMGRLQDWIGGLSAPGVLVVGQPIFANRMNWTGNFQDWNLPNFSQYDPLCRSLLESRQPIVLLAGDVHYGRVARAVTTSGVDLIEIISSPMALVDRSAGGKWSAAPERFPAFAVAGAASVPVETVETWERFADHFLTLEFADFGDGVDLKVRTWEVSGGSGTPDPLVFHGRLRRRV